MTGSGVGLAICKQLIDLMDGTISCKSAPGEGTVFTVTLDLPIADNMVDELMLPPMRVLLVDDDDVFLATASDTLRDMGLTLDAVSSGEEAVAIVTEKHAQGNDYPVIIVDWQMPGMDGDETTRAIRARVGEDVSIIVISAYAPEDIRDAALAAGANGFISKPFFRSTVHHNMSEILGLVEKSSVANAQPEDQLKGMKLLVAEDNDLNWEIVNELMRMYSVTCTRAENGRVCVKLLQSEPVGTFDLVLMDIQMPIMNGYEASMAIRNMGRAGVDQIPIIAMTADAFTEDVMHCIECGMNAHIAKPVEMDQLLELLAKYWKPKK